MFSVNQLFKLQILFCSFVQRVSKVSQLSAKRTFQFICQTRFFHNTLKGNKVFWGPQQYTVRRTVKKCKIFSYFSKTVTDTTNFNEPEFQGKLVIYNFFWLNCSSNKFTHLKVGKLQTFLLLTN